MNKKIQSRFWWVSPVMAATVAVAFSTFSAKAGPVIGPPNPGFEQGGANWNSGASGSGAVNFVNFANEVTNGPSAPGSNCVMEASDGSGNADLRVNNFSLGAATQGTNAISIDFDYNILGPITGGDQIRVGCRFEDSGGGFLGEHNFYLGSPNNDVGGTGWHHFHGVAADPTLTAVTMDIRITMNIFGDDTWHSGSVLYDNFVVKVTPSIGVNHNGDFENGGANWNSGGPGGSAGSENFYNPTNGPSAPGTNCMMMTADGSVSPPNGNDLRVNNFWLGGATRGINGAVSVDFDYNILNPIYSGDQIRVGLRFEDSGGGFLGENNFHIGSPNNDVGGTGWHHFHGVATDPTHSAVTADLRLTMNIFGDDNWGSGPVLMDNFVVKATPVIGPNENGDFEEGSATWNAGGPNNASGYDSFYNALTNGPGELGTNCALMSADGSIQSGGNDMRVNEFLLANNGQPVTISFDYNILNPITSANQIRVGFRFFDSGNNFTGEHNTYIGSPNGDLGAQGWKHIAVTYPVPSGAVQADIRVSMNIFGDDLWNNGPVLFDNFVVTTGSNVPPVAATVLMGTVTNIPVTRLTAGPGQEQGIIEPDGILDYSFVSGFTQPAHGIVTANNGLLTYVATNGYVGADSFAFMISDGLGGLVTNTASVLVNSTAGTNKFTLAANAGNNNAVFTFAGAGDCDYVLQSAPSLTSPIIWTPVLTNQADATGSIIFTNQESGPVGFLRTVLVP